MRRFRMNSRGRGPTRPAFDVRVLEVGFRPVHKCLPRPNGPRLSCGALKKDSFPNLRAPPASSAC